MAEDSTDAAWKRFDSIRIAEAARRIDGVVRRTPLVPLDLGIAGAVEVRGKLENRQETGSFKARGAWNQISQLTPEERARGVVAASSGNHGKALAWAARRAGIPATIVMPSNAYPNKVEACRELGAEVVLAPTREGADEACARLVESGRILVHPYDAARTIEGAGTVGLEIADDWPEVDVVIVPVGGGGLISGTSLALRRALGSRVRIVGAEPSGAPSLTRGIEAGEPVFLPKITSRVQGLTPHYSGRIDIEICRATLDEIVLFEDEEAFEAQRRLVGLGETVEPAGAAAAAVAMRIAKGPGTRVAVVVSGGNPDPAQIESVRASLAGSA